MNKTDIKKISDEVIKIQEETIEKLKINIADDVSNVIEYLAKLDGKIIITGIGKSALVGMKVAATLNSTGSPSVFMHGSDALHGDMGILSNEDAVIFISKSGNNNETIELVKTNLNINLKLNGIILTMYDKRNSLSSLIEKEAREYFDTTVYKFNVPRNVTLSEAPSHGLPAIIYDLKCSGSQAYIALAREFLERSNLNGSQ